MKKVSVLAGLTVCIVFLLTESAADARDRELSIRTRGSNNFAQLQVNRGLFGRVRQVNVTTGPVVGRVQEVRFQPAYTNSQLIVSQRHRGQLNQLNSYTYATNTAQNIRFVRQGVTYLQQAPIVGAYVQPAQVIERIEVAPQLAPQTAPCPCENQSAAPALNPDVQYQRLPQRVERVETDYCPQAQRVQRITATQQVVFRQRVYSQALNVRNVRFQRQRQAFIRNGNRYRHNL